MNLNFRSSLHGFNRQDVANYLEYLNNRHAAQVNQLNTDLEALRRQAEAPAEDPQRTALEARCRELEHQLSIARQERDEALAQREAAEQKLASARQDREEALLRSCGEKLDMAQLQEIWEGKLEPVYPYRKAGPTVEPITGSLTAPAAPKIGVAKPKVIIPVFPGTNCEYDTAKAFARAGADPEILVIRNLTPADVTASCEALVKAIDNSQIVMLPGGFSGGDEPDGSAKFIASFFRSPAVTEAVRDLLQHRDGLMLGICNGFQALIKLGLVPYGDIRPITAYDPTLTFNTIGRHQSMLVRTRVASTGSPWLSHCDAGSEYEIAISHGEGRFVAPQNVLDQLVANGQVATQYVDLEGEPTMDQRYNPNGSLLAIEGITSPDGCVFGKMGHSERSGEYLYKNVTGDKYQPIFEGGVDYFKI